jgi:hypothetical protein
VIGRKANRIRVALRFKVSVHLRLGECRVASKKPTDVRIPVASYHRFQYRPPVISPVNLSVAQQRPLQIAKLVEVKQRVIAGAAEVAVVGRALLLAVGRTDRTVHVQDQLANRLVFADPIHQHTGQVHQLQSILSRQNAYQQTLSITQALRNRFVILLLPPRRST